MKTLKIALLTLAIFATIFALASCAKKALSFDESYNFSEEDDSAEIFNQKKNWTHPKNWELYSTLGNYAIFSKYDDENNTTKYHLYSIENDEKVFETSGTIDSRVNISLNYDNEITVICVKEDDEYKTYLLDGKGNTIATADERIVFSSDYYYDDHSNIYGDFFVFDEKVYYANEEGIKFYCDEPAFCDLEFLEDVFVTDKYLIEIDTYCIRYYNTDFELVATHSIPSYATDIDAYILSNNDVFVQYSIVLDIMEDKYDFIDANDYKCNLVQYIYNLEDNKTKDVDVDGYVLGIGNNNYMEEDYFAEEIKNAIILAPIVDYHIDANACTLHSMEDNAKIKKELYSPFDVAVMIESLGDGYYFAESIGPDSRYAILNSKGEIIKNVKDSYIERCDYGFVYDYNSSFKVYDDSFNVKFDSKDKNILINNDTYIIYSEVDEDDETRYYRFDKNGKKEIEDDGEWEVVSVSSVTNGIYRVDYTKSKGGRTYAYYSADGKVLFERSELSRSVYLSSDNVIIFYAYSAEDDETVYSRVTRG